MPLDREFDTKGPTKGDMKEVHPAFGLIGISRVSGEGYLFGSDVSHGHHIRLHIKQANRRRSTLHYDTYGAETASFIEVGMTFQQFTEMVMTQNVGEGTPCTILYKDYKPVERLEKPKHTLEFLTDEAKVRVNAMQRDVENLRAKLAAMEIGDTKLNKGNVREALDEANRLHQSVGGSLEFFLEQVQEAVEGMVAKGRAEVEGYTQHMLQERGLAAYQEKLAAGKPMQEPKFLGDGEPTGGAVSDVTKAVSWAFRELLFVEGVNWYSVDAALRVDIFTRNATKDQRYQIYDRQKDLIEAFPDVSFDFHLTEAE